MISSSTRVKLLAGDPCTHCVFESVWVWTPWCSRQLSPCVGTPQRAAWIVHQGSPPPIALTRSWWPCWTVWGEEVSTASLVTPYPNSHFPTSWQSWPQWTRWVLPHVTGGQLFHITEACSVRTLHKSISNSLCERFTEQISVLPAVPAHTHTH